MDANLTIAIVMAVLQTFHLFGLGSALKEINALRAWRHDLNASLMGIFLTRDEAKILVEESRTDRARLWVEHKDLRVRVERHLERGGDLEAT